MSQHVEFTNLDELVCACSDDGDMSVFDQPCGYDACDCFDKTVTYRNSINGGAWHFIGKHWHDACLLRFLLTFYLKSQDGEEA